MSLSTLVTVAQWAGIAAPTLYAGNPPSPIPQPPLTHPPLGSQT
jgi:hypothetical protein